MFFLDIFNINKINTFQHITLISIVICYTHNLFWQLLTQVWIKQTKTIWRVSVWRIYFLSITVSVLILEKLMWLIWPFQWLYRSCWLYTMSLFHLSSRFYRNCNVTDWWLLSCSATQSNVHFCWLWTWPWLWSSSTWTIPRAQEQLSLASYFKENTMIWHLTGTWISEQSSFSPWYSISLFPSLNWYLRISWNASENVGTKSFAAKRHPARLNKNISNYTITTSIRSNSDMPF